MPVMGRESKNWCNNVKIPATILNRMQSDGEDQVLWGKISMVREIFILGVGPAAM